MHPAPYVTVCRFALPQHWFNAILVLQGGNDYCVESHFGVMSRFGYYFRFGKLSVTILMLTYNLLTL